MHLKFEHNFRKFKDTKLIFLKNLAGYIIEVEKTTLIGIKWTYIFIVLISV
jgi:hypothetical protein